MDKSRRRNMCSCKNYERLPNNILDLKKTRHCPDFLMNIVVVGDGVGREDGDGEAGVHFKFDICCGAACLGADQSSGKRFLDNSMKIRRRISIEADRMEPI